MGILDYGNGYAAKSGTGRDQRGRRLLFGFTGWQAPTMPEGCGRAMVLPRELSLQGSRLLVEPSAELRALRVPGSRAYGLPAAPVRRPRRPRRHVVAWTMVRRRFVTFVEYDGKTFPSYKLTA